MSAWPDLLHEDPNERAIFDDNAELLGSPLMAVWSQLNAASVMAPKQGSWGRYLAVMANEVRAAMIAQADLAAARAEGAEATRRGAAQVLRKKAADYHAEHGSYDPSTGVTEYPGNGDEWMNDWEETADAIDALPIPAADALHPDDRAVDAFAGAMKAKMAAARDKGRHGWDDPAICPTPYLAGLFIEHCFKANRGNMADLANFAMMLHTRGEEGAVADALARREVDDLGTDELRARAKRILKKNGWKPNDNPSLHSTIELIVALAIDALRAPPHQCAAPECGCCDDASCNAAIRARAVGEERL